MGKEKNTSMAVLCYLGLLVLIPLLTDAKNEPFVKFHIKQGLVLLISGVIVSAVMVLPIFGRIVGSVAWLVVLVLIVIGALNALGGKEEELPIIGQYGKNLNI